jgi:hypothetical protein
VTANGPHSDHVAAISDRRTAAISSPSEGVRLLDRLARLFGGSHEEERGDAAESNFLWGSLEVRRLLGRGSFGEVYAAWDPTLHREVALKLRNPEVGTLRWLDEARNLARIRHPNVLTVHGADVLDGRAGIWTERIQGQTLEEILSSEGPFAEAEVVRIGRDLASALAAVHDAGLVHGDVKASNTMLEDGAAPRRAVLVDFGSADKPPAEDEIPAYAIGTPLTMAPEVLEGRAASASSDVYGLGATLFRLLTGRYPVEAQSIDELKHAHASRQRLGLRATAPNVSSRLARAIDRALEPDPAQRWPNAHTLQRALEDVADPTRRIRVRAAAVGAGVAALAGIATIAFLATRPGPGPISRGKLPPPLMPNLYHAGWRYAGNADVAFGWMAAIVDLDGDGRAELVAQEPEWKNELGKVCGRTLVFKGAAAGPDPAPSTTWAGDRDGEVSAALVTNAGDVNGDGYGDLLVSDESSNPELPARVRLYSGGPSGVAASPAWSIEGGSRDTGLGRTMTSAGDVNHDGYGDVLIGESQAGDSLQGEGVVRLYMGSAAGLSRTPAWIARGGQTGASLGDGMEKVGDVNRDGYDDVLVGAVLWDGANADCGQARLFFGGAHGVAARPAWKFDGAGPYSHLGRAVSGAGDINGDGYDDVLIGEPQYSDPTRPERGRALVFLGGPRGPSRAPDWQALGPAAYSHFGQVVLAAGDVDGDGFDDIAISATQYTDGKHVHLGMVELYRGGRAGLETRAAWRVVGDTADCHLGTFLAAGDLNGDHIPDLVACAPLWGDREPKRGLILAFLGQRRH